MTAGGDLLRALFVVTVLAAPGVAAAVEQLRFDVFLDDDPIGEHVFRFERSATQQRVEIEASFDVSVLFVPVYTYRHVNTEVWQDGCLRSLRSRTDSNGDLFNVRGEELGDTFSIETGSRQQLLDTDCVMSFAYWDQRILDQNRLLNAQTGELIEVDIERLGTTQVTVNADVAEADGYRITSDDGTVDIRVVYAATDGRWLALESRLPNGRVMRYAPAAGDRLADARARDRK
jgi:hypothetical protein